MKKQLLTIILFLLSSHSSSSSYDPTNDLIGAYCQSLGPRTRGALSHAEAMSSILKAIRDDEKCSVIYRNFQDVYNNYSLSQKSNGLVTSIQKRDLEVSGIEDLMDAERAQLTENFQLRWEAQNPDATPEERGEALGGYEPQSSYLEALRFRYSESQLALMDAQIEAGVLYSDQPKKADNLDRFRAFNASTITLFSSIQQNTQCLRGQANLAIQIGSQVLGAAASLQNSVVGSALIGVGTIASATDMIFRELKISGHLKAIEGPRIQTAVGCALDSLTANFCKIRDADKILEYQAYLKQHSEIKKSREIAILRGVELVSQYLPSYNTWLQRAVAGSNPNDTAQAELRISKLALRSRLESFQQSIGGLINETKRKFLAVKDQKTRENIRLGLMNGLIRRSSGGIFVFSSGTPPVPEGPYSEFFAEDIACGPLLYFLTGKIKNSEIKFPRDERPTSNCRFESIDKERTNAELLVPPSIEEIESRFGQLQQSAVAFVNREIGIVIEEDPSLVLGQFSSIEPFLKTSAEDFFVQALNYLLLVKINEVFKDNERMDKVTDKLLENLQEGLDIIQRKCDLTLTKKKCTENKAIMSKEEVLYKDLLPLTPIVKQCKSVEMIKSCVMDASVKITEIVSLLAPNQQTLYIANALQEVLKQHLDFIIKNKTLKQVEVYRLINVLRERPNDLILRNYLGSLLTKEDILGAQYLYESNLKGLSSFFGKHIYQKILSLSNNQLMSKRNKAKALGLECARVNLMPREVVWGPDEKYLKRICSKYSLKSLYPEKISDISFSKERSKKWRDRVCTLFEFRRRHNIFELKKK